jgi:hypothetical protein
MPTPVFLEWLVKTGAKLIIELVDRGDIMVKQMLSRKTDQHADYDLQYFEEELQCRYDIVIESAQLKQQGERKIYCSPRTESTQLDMGGRLTVRRYSDL